MTKMHVGYLVTFKNPNPDEIGLVMRILELKIDRALVECLVGMNINPTQNVLISDVRILTKAERDNLNKEI